MSGKSANGASAARLEACLARIADPALEGDKVFSQVFAEEARLAAAAADQRAAPLGPLDGRVVSVKNLFDVAGRVTTAGSAVLRGHPAAPRDAAVVARLRGAGAVIVGKTHMTEFAFSGIGINPHDGNPGNPRDRSLIPGGSSSGAVISVLDGMADIGLGSDTGGSLRIPAALCGAVGFKPSSGRVPTDGAFPLSTTLDTVGAIARTVADCAWADEVLSGVPLPAPQPFDRDGLTLTIPRGRLFDMLDAPVARAFERAADTLRAAGFLVRDGSIEAELDLQAELDGVGTFPSVELSARLEAEGLADLAGIDPKIAARIEAGRRVLATDYLRMIRLRAQMVERMDRHLASGEILVLPTVPMLAPAISRLVEDDAEFHRINGLILRNTRVANLFDLPAISLPVGGAPLPVGLMLAGRRLSDRRLLAAAAAIEPLIGDR
ncbi:amidase [Telmatospirillum siberiense]|uniref:Amidase n=1 Tax=Telmatospirillum siberiense TaxID=382514 RepID=A0A2N3PQN5_9PROT|nr:amidase [Telmatospirillum siberiense]PKU22711.1 amidase [Telmatospirillum siberiense]